MFVRIYMSNEESWSTKCSKCGSIITIEASIKESLIKYQTVSELVEAEATVLDTDGEELDLVCDGCFRTIEWWDCDHYADPDLGHTGYDDDMSTAYVKPNSWVKGQMHKSVEESGNGLFDGKEDEITDVEEKNEMKKEQSMSEPTVDEVLARWTIGHKLYFLQFALAGIDEHRVTNDEMQTIMRRMKTNKAIQEKLGKDGYHDEEQRFKDAEIIYNQAEKEGNLIRQSAVFISAVAESYKWNEQALTLLYGEMFEVVMADGEIWHGERYILQMMVDEWGIMAGPFLRGMTDASGISF